MLKTHKINNVMMSTAIQWSKMSYAVRKQVGAVLASQDGRILLTAYNGTVEGADNECEYVTEEECTECNGGHIIKGNTLHSCNNCNGDYTLKTKPETLHAEMNIICYSARKGISTENTIMYVTMSPCIDCAKLIIASGIKEVYYLEEYKDLSGVEFLSKYIKVNKIDILS